MSKKPSRRRKLTCANSVCKAATKEQSHAQFSTYSSNRSVCHACKPKCYEQHFFGDHPLAPKKKKEQKDQPAVSAAA